MSDPQQLDRELREYLETEPNLRKADRLAYLKTIINKHLDLNKLEHVVNNDDLFYIFSAAKSNYTKQRMPVTISKKQLEPSEVVHISVLESFISYLNKTNLLKKLVKFDYTE